METNFQTSFIPKKPVASQVNVRHHTSVSIFMILATFLFIISIGMAGFTFFAKSILLRSQEQAKIELKANEDKYNLPLIEDLKKVNAKIDLANQLLKNHIAVSEVFDIISKLTIEGVRFSDFEFSEPIASGIPAASNVPVYTITMRGIANNYNSVAFQSDVFGSSQRYGTNKVLRNPILSNLSVDESGNVVFDFTAEIVQSDISYENVLKETLRSEGVIPNNNQ
jgi:hypothetical protein